MTDPKVFGFYFGLLCCHHILSSVFGCCSVFILWLAQHCQQSLDYGWSEAYSYTLQVQKYIQLYLPSVFILSTQLNVKCNTLAQTIKWNRPTNGVKILQSIFIILCGLALDDETKNYGTAGSPGRGPSWTLMWELLPLGLFLFCPLEGVREHDMQGVLWKGVPVLWLLEDKFSATHPRRQSKPELLEVVSRQR